MSFTVFTRAILGNRHTVAVLLIFVVAGVASGIARLGADFSVRAFFAVDDPEVAYFESYAERWGDDDMLVITLDGDGETLLTRQSIEAMEALAVDLEAVDGVEKVLALPRVPRVNRGVAGVWIPVPLRGTIPNTNDPSDARLMRWREAILADSQVVPAFLSEDGHYGAVLVALSIDTNDLAQVRPVVHAVEDVVGTHEEMNAAGVRTAVAGIPAIRADVLDVIVKDQIVLVPVAAVAMGVLLLVLFRSRHGVLIPGVAAGVPLFMLLGVMGWTGESFGLLNQVFLALVPAIAVADAIHLVGRFHEASQQRSTDGQLDETARDEAIVDAMAFMGKACFLTSFTTIVGFLSLTSTSLPVLKGFGLYAAVGVALAYFTVLFIVPLLLLWTRSSARRLGEGEDGLLGRFLDASATATTERPWTCLGLATLAIVLAGIGAQRVTVDTRVTRTFDDVHPTTLANDVVDAHLGGVMALEFDLKGNEGAFDDPAVLKALSEIEASIAERPDVRATWSPSRLLAATSVLVGGPEQVPQDARLIQRLYGLAGDSGALDALLDEPHGQSRLMVRTRDLGAVGFLALGDTLQEEVSSALEAVDVDAHLTGSSFVAYRGLSRVTSDLRDSLVMAFFVIGIIITVLFRSLRLGLLSIPPNALPLWLGYGAMGAFGWSLEPAPAVVFTIAIGVGVDSAIHLIARFEEERGLGHSVRQAVTASIHHSGRAIAITAIILIVGFAVNIASSSPANASFGKLGSLILVAALISNLVVLPAMLVVGHPEPRSST